MKPRKSVAIGPFTVGDDSPVCIVAELGVNHLGDPQRMRDMIAAAVECGADLLKFQTYLKDKRYDQVGNPKGRQFTETVGRWQLSRDQEAELWEYAKSLGATVFTSPFDLDSLAFADDLGSAAYKLAAFEIVNHDLVRGVAARGKPVVLSRGMATLDEVRECVEIIEAAGSQAVILHTISSYPTLRRDSNLWMIHVLREAFDNPIGHSDHTRGTDIPPLAVAAGARMIEKHFTVNPKLRESDNPFSITPGELEDLVYKVRRTERFMGREVTRVETENYMWDFRRETR